MGRMSEKIAELVGIDPQTIKAAAAARAEAGVGKKAANGVSQGLSHRETVLGRVQSMQINQQNKDDQDKLDSETMVDKITSTKKSEFGGTSYGAKADSDFEM